MPFAVEIGIMVAILAAIGVFAYLLEVWALRLIGMWRRWKA